MAVVALLMLGFFAFLVLRASTPSYAPLYTDLSLDDSAAITKELQTMNIPFQLRGDGDAILVPRDQVTSVRMSLASDGLPTKGQVGYEIFDKQSTLGATSFVQNINNVRALEGELARTISSLTRVKSARVHLVLPQRELFSREQKPPTASIVLDVRGELSSGQVRAIQHLVASAVEGLTPDRVAIVDETGTLLASGEGDNGQTGLDGDAIEQTQALDNSLRKRVETLLTSIVGPGRAHVQVTAQLNMDRSTTTSETFDPNGQVARSTQSKQLANSSTGPSDSGAVSVSNSLPGAAQNANSGTTGAGGGSTGSNEQGSTTEETTNYEISKTTSTSTTQAGGIKRLSVAVVVDGTYSTDAKGNSVYTPRPPAQLNQIKALVQSAVGYDAKRGDQVDVANLQFATPPAPPALGESAPGLFAFTRDDLMNGAQMLVTLLISLALVFFVMRPLLKRVLAPETTPLALPPNAELPPDAQTGADHPRIENGSADPGAAAWMNNAKSMGESQLQTIKTVGGLVDENPKQAALIVRDWLNNAA